MHGDRYLPLGGAGTHLIRSLCSAEGSRSSTSRFERYSASLGTSMRDNAILEHSRARLALFHQSHRFANPMLGFLRRYSREDTDASNVYARSVLNPDESCIVNMLYWDSARTAQMLSRRGRHADARWTFGLLMTKIPKRMRTGRDYPKTTAGHTRLPRARTAHERSRGVQYAPDLSIRGLGGT